MWTPHDYGHAVNPKDGCLHPASTNYDFTATFDDGSCCFPDPDPCLPTPPYPPVYPEAETNNP